MLAPHRYTEVERMLSSEYMYFDRNVNASRRYVHGSYIEQKSIGGIMLPLAINEIGIKQSTYIESATDGNSVDMERVVNEQDNVSDRQLGIIRIYTHATSMPAILEVLNDITKDAPNGVQELYNKCMSQVQARQNITRELTTKIKVHKTKHIVYLISDYNDNDQASDYFLTVGLIPVLFQDWKDRFCTTELEYFKAIVNRSLVKRISNVTVNNYYDALLQLPKYKNLEEEIRMNAVLDSIVNSRLYTARQNLQNAETNAEQSLSNYNRYKAIYFESLKTLNDLEATQESVRDDLKAALKIEGIHKVDVSGSIIKIYFKAPMCYYNAEEAEIIIKNKPDTLAKRLLEDVFIKQKYKMHVLTMFTFKLNDPANFATPSYINSGTHLEYNAFFNPHIHFHSCLGDYRPQLVAAHSNSDLLLFNNLALASTKSLNFRDAIVMNNFISKIDEYANYYNRSYDAKAMLDAKCLEDEDGVMHSIAEVYLNVTPVEAVELEAVEL